MFLIKEERAIFQIKRRRDNVSDKRGGGVQYPTCTFKMVAVAKNVSSDMLKYWQNFYILRGFIC